MTLRERILSLYRGQTPDIVPFMLDLQHWYLHKHGLPWNIRLSYEQPECELLDFHRDMGVGFYMPNLASFFAVSYPSDVEVLVEDGRRPDDTPTITWRYRTPIGEISRTRVWQPSSYSWALDEFAEMGEQDLRILGYAMSRRIFTPHWEKYRAWTDYLGEDGIVYLPLGYSGMGNLLNAWLGVEHTIFAISDWPDTVREVVDRINENNLTAIDMLAQSPAEVILLGDNFSSDIQPPSFFAAWSQAYYTEAIRRLHAAGKCVAVHIDGRLKGALRMIRETGADCADAVTPLPMGDLTPAQCREEAGADFMLSGGISPDLLLYADDAMLQQAMLRWLDLRRQSSRLIMGVGDEMPLGVPVERIAMMRDFVEEHGRY